MDDEAKSSLLTFILSDSKFTKQRLPSLYSDFTRLKLSNAEGYNANVKAWQAALSQATQQRLTSHSSSPFIIDIGVDLQYKLSTPDYGTPLALDTVLRESQQHGQWVEVDEFKAWKTAQSTDYSLSRFLEWTMSNLFGEDRRSISLRELRLVIVQNLKNERQRVMQLFQERTSVDDTPQVYSRDIFREVFFDAQKGSPKLNDEDIGLILSYMSHYTHDLVTVKFRDPKQKDTEITEFDDCVVLLKDSLNAVSRRMERLRHQLDDRQQAAHDAVHKKQQASALAALRSKKLIEKALSDSLAMLARLEELLHSIVSASQNAELVRIMEDASKALEEVNRSTGGIDYVEFVISKFREDAEDAQNIQNALSQTANVADDEVEIEQELEKMLRSEEAPKIKRPSESETGHVQDLQDKLPVPPGYDLHTSPKETPHREEESESVIGAG